MKPITSKCNNPIGIYRYLFLRMQLDKKIVLKSSNLGFLLLFFLISFSSNLHAQDLNRIIKSEPFKMTGSISANGGLYSANGIDDRASSMKYGIAARLNFRIYSFDFPVFASFRDNRLNYGYSYSRFRINPQYKWIKLHVGDTNMKFNPYTLSGRTVKGGGVELTPGMFRFKALYGKIEDLNSYRDTLNLGTYLTPTYTRKLAGVSLGFGKRSSYLDLYAIKSWDRLDSLNGEKFYEDFTRKDNVVVGSTFKLKLFKKLTINSDVGVSLLTDNIDSFTPNESIGENEITDYVIEANGTSKYSYAGNVSLAYSGRKYSLNGKVRYVQPYFQPLSLAYIATDLVNYTVGGSINLFNNKVFLTGNVGVQENNLSGVKLSTSNSLIANLNSNIRLSKNLNANIQYSNFAQDYVAKSITIEDLYTFAITNNNMGISLKYRKKLKENTFTSGISVAKSGFSTVTDNEDYSKSYDNLNASLQLGYRVEKMGLNINTAINYRTYERENDNSANYGLRGSVSKSFMDKKVTTSLRSTYSLIQKNDIKNGTNLNNKLNISYKTTKKSSLSLIISQIQRNFVDRDGYSEIRSNLRYTQRF